MLLITTALRIDHTLSIANLLALTDFSLSGFASRAFELHALALQAHGLLGKSSDSAKLTAALSELPTLSGLLRQSLG